MNHDLYVINNRLPRFPLKEHYPNRRELEIEVDQAFQVWLRERILGNLQRRKAASQAHDFSVWLQAQGKVLESVSQSDFAQFLKHSGEGVRLEWTHFMVFIRRRIPSLEWE